MSDPVTALAGQSATGIVTTADAGAIGMITLRADLADPGLASALAEAGFDLPGQGAVTGTTDKGTLWMSPDEVLLLCPHGEADALVASLSNALKDTHHLAVNVSDARTTLRLSGDNAAIREVLAKLSPADLRTEALPRGRVRRTRIAQIAAAVWFTAEDEALVVAFRSTGDYLFKLVSKVAEDGSRVGYF